MSEANRELTTREKQRIKKRIVSQCANCHKEYGFLPQGKRVYCSENCDEAAAIGKPQPECVSTEKSSSKTPNKPIFTTTGEILYDRR